MIIHATHKYTHEHSVTVSAYIEWETANPAHPRSLWYTVPIRYEHDLSKLSDGFLIPLVSVAMFHREDVHVRGLVSSVLMYALDTYQSIMQFWHPEFFSQISITADAVVSPDASATSGTMCTYTGGVDSTYTLWSHLPENEKLNQFNITHALYITEMGLQRESDESISEKVGSFSALLDALEIEFIPVKTNVKQFQQFGHQTPMYMSDASLILGPVALFHGVVDRFLFASDATHDFEMLETINHTLVPLLATGTMHVHVHGASVPRYEKLNALTQWPMVHDRLVVCWKHPNGLKNCGRCYKCCYTMAAIEFGDNAGVFTTFPPKIDHKSMRACRAEKGLVYILEKWSTVAIQRRKWSIAIDYTWALWISRVQIFLEDTGLDRLLRPIDLLYRVSALLRRKSSVYSQVLDKVKRRKRLNI